MRSLNLALVQADLYWHDPAANRQHLSELLANVGDVDVVVLPEMFSTGFTMQPQVAHERMDGETLHWMAALAKRLDAVVCGSLAMAVGNRFVNRFCWVRPSSEITHYDKRHLFRMSGEHEHYDAGTHRIVVELNGWRVCPLICYDLRFPVFSRAQGDYDLLLYVANWPAARQMAWEALLKARAIENLAYVVAVNRVGVDGNGLAYAGGSGVITPTGATLQWSRQSESVSYVQLDAQLLQRHREGFPAWRDADAFQLL